MDDPRLSDHRLESLFELAEKELTCDWPLYVKTYVQKLSRSTYFIYKLALYVSPTLTTLNRPKDEICLALQVDG